jgi:hypothetical protein
MNKTSFVKGIRSVSATKFKGMMDLLPHALPDIVTILKPSPDEQTRRKILRHLFRKCF